MGTAAIVGGTIASAGISGAASMVGAGEQASAAQSAAQIQQQEQQASLAEQQREFNITQQNEAPFIQAGQGAVNQLGSYANFTAPTAAQAAAYPGEQFQLQTGEQAIQAANAATGNVFSGTALNAADQYAQGLAQTDYGNVYNQALGTYTTNLNRLQSLAGEGQTATGQEAQAGQAAATNIANVNMATGAQIGSDIQNAAAAEASGYVGAGNAITGATNNLGQYALLNSLLNPNVTSGINLNSMPANYNPAPTASTYDPASLGASI